MNHKILIVEDDPSIFMGLQEKLEQWSFDVVGVDDFQEVMTVFDEQQPQVVILDIQLPVYDGFHWCRQIRQVSNVPIIFLSSRDHPMDMIMAMQMGADDYIQKPFHMDVLLAKVQALLRRVYAYSDEPSEGLEWNGATIDLKRNIIAKNGLEVELTKNEYFILIALVEEAGKILSRDDLIRRLWDDERFVNDNTLTVNVNRLRQKLSELQLDQYILTKKGLGYLAEIESDVK